MIKQLKDMTRYDIGNTCRYFSNNFIGDCSTNCPFYMKEAVKVGRSKTTNCKTTYKYITKYPNEEIKLKGEQQWQINVSLLQD